MATKSSAAPKAKLNRSQAVRDYLAQHPGTSPRAIQDALKSKGIKISESLASAIKYAKKKGVLDSWD